MNNLPFELHVALRYLLAKRKQAFISVISLISTLGVGVGVMAVVIALAIMTGLQQELRDRILGSNPHIYVLSRDGFRDYQAEIGTLRRMPHVAGAAPAILGRALVSAQGRNEPVQIKGIDPQLDTNAMRAFAQWRFRPAERNGEPVDLEAIVHIPFRLPER